VPSSTVQSFTDPDDYAASFRVSQAELAVVGRGVFSAKLVRIDLHRLWLQNLSDNLPRVVRSVNVPGRAFIGFRTGPGPRIIRNGVEHQSSDVVRYTGGQTSFLRSSGPSTWASMSLPIADLADAGSTMAGFDLTPPNDLLTVTPSPPTLAKLQQLHTAATYLAEHSPGMLVNADAARGLEQDLILAMVACLNSVRTTAERSANRRRDAIMKRFWTTIESNRDHAIHLPELCSATGVSARVLYECCREHFGLSPMRYLWLRRMTLARTALIKGDAATTTVTDIATAQGFWELGRFAVQYRQLFGERPSITLHRPPDAPRNYPVRINGPEIPIPV
jgi:AraC-like DNA-binding protein